MTIQDFVRLTRVNALLLLVCTVLGGTFGFGYAQLQLRTYEATTSALVVVAGTDAFTANSVAQQKATAFASLVASRTVKDATAKSLGVGDLGGSLRGAVDSASPIIHITASSNSATRARDIANASVAALGAEVTRLESFASPSQGAAAVVEDGGDGQGEEPTADIAPVAVDKTTSTQILALEEAGVPTAPVYPDIPKISVMGALGGLVFGYFIAFMRRALDNRVRHNSDVEEATGASVLAVVPRSNELNKDGRRHVDGLGEAAEALRHLRTNLRFLDVDNPPRAIVMTSANPGEGKSTISAVLAQMLAASGQRTILVDCDLRKPVVHKIFDLDGSVGLTQVLAGDMQVAQVAQGVTDQPHLRVITAGRIPPNPSELLGSQRMKALLDRLSEEAIVILDAPPLLPVTDSGLLAGLADGAIVVMEVGGTYKEQACLCAKVLNQVDARLLGVVLNRASKRQIGSVYYGYGYGNYGHSYYYYGNEEKGKFLGIFPRRKKRRSAGFGEMVVEEQTDLPSAPLSVPDGAAEPDSSARRASRRHAGSPARNDGAEELPPRFPVTQRVSADDPNRPTRRSLRDR
ncbi:MAG: polysaccharide biosynthesis tyrosine autokinase [Actinomyces urogenitalis]|uniref:polysaccharide biosynthesis tyrosine autokinase n=1 Tax=Actinomyces urogenitalis TaxID=103621 RepID=UPI002A8202D5|nr:polysaccharide biosynthesis tyrosine autokinase [Actinomyces urogenitalis]MDY3677845.1 polysaccharide biosynthesis tyrosine autokinase [Actinomyces urogenitalis]